MQAQNYLLDFSKGDSMDVINNSEVSLRDLELEDLYATPRGQYEIHLDNANRFIIPADRGQLRIEMEKEEEVRNLELITPILSIQETYALSDFFHEQFGLSSELFYEWAQPAEKHKFPRGFYGKTFTKNYPTIGMSVHSSFNKNKPFFIQFQFSWDNWLHKSRGTSVESNQLQGFTFDVPRILESVKAEVSEPAVVEEPEPASEPKEIYEETNPVEVIFDEVEIPEPSEKPEEQTSQWWLWLVGALVVLGGLAVVVRRKS